MNLQTSTTLNNGVEMPMLGLGVYAPDDSDKDVQQAVEWALEAGCRLIDTASIYGNEAAVGQALRSSGLRADAVFVTTKVWKTDQGYDQTLRAFDQSLKKLQLDVLDLYLIHWPVQAHRHDTWRAMEKLYADGRVRAIGVSNHYPKHLDDLLSRATVVPAVNQIEFTPYCYRADVEAYCRQRNIRLEAYSPLVRGEKKDDPRLVAIAERHGKSTFQVLIRWVLQHGAVAIPKSVSKKRIQHNFDVFDFALTDAEVAEMDTFFDNTRMATDPDTLA